MDEVFPPIHFIDAAVTVRYKGQPPLLSKKPSCPDEFVWEERVYTIKTMLAQWSDFQRRGRMARNMQPAHAQTDSLRGSWGVGRFFFRVETVGGRIFDLYYDRAPRDASDRGGNWFLLGERKHSAGKV
jgi:hypothetical protein